MKKIELKDIQMNYPSAKLWEMSREDKEEELAFLEACMSEMPSQQTSYDIEVIRLHMFMAYGSSNKGKSLETFINDLGGRLAR